MKTTSKGYCMTMTARSLAEKAYNIATTQYVSNSSRGQAIRDMESLIDPHIRKPSDFKADIFKDPIFKAAMDELEREKEAEVLLRELKSYYTVCDPPNPNTINFNRSAEGVFKKIAKFLEEGRATSPVRIPFDLELAKQGHKVVTRDGRDVEIVADDLSGDYPVLATIIGEDGYKTFAAFMSDGVYNLNRQLPFDLFILKEPETVSIKIYRSTKDGTYWPEIEENAYDKLFDPELWEYIKTVKVKV